MTNRIVYAEEWVNCINYSFTKNHLVNIRSKKTRCGLRWNKKPQLGHVWTPMAVAFFGTKGKCKKCYRGGVV